MASELLAPQTAESPDKSAQSCSLAPPEDIAGRFRLTGTSRFDVKFLGFHPENRGDVGCNSWHIHDVALDCSSNGVSLRRYNSVEICKIPLDKLAWVRAANQQKCDDDPLMPHYSEHITHVILTHTHFVHAVKLAAEGGRTFRNDASGKK